MLSSVSISRCGIMTNYECTAACRHCLYACSPTRSGGYLKKEKATEICALLRKAGCHSVHIGGGEPFLDFTGLLVIINEVLNSGMAIEYIETNAFWAIDESFTAERLKQLLWAGGNALCVSLDPFHAEYIPPERPMLLTKICERVGMGYFLWKRQYVDSLIKAGPSTAHTRAELEATLSPTYIRDTAVEYGIFYGGRALMIEEEYSRKQPAEEFSRANPCRNVLSSKHCHVDLNGDYIPSGCTGIKLPLREVVNGIPEGKYPVFETLYESGAAGILRYAKRKGFHPDDDGYTSTCAMCARTREWLSRYGDYAELDGEHYEAAKSYY